MKDSLRTNRSHTDFSKHVHTVELYQCGDKQIRVDKMKVDGTRWGYIQFVNTDEGMSVFGDYGNWIFCRPFIPSSDGYVSGGYWDEKLRMASEQDSSKYDSEATAKEIELLIASGLEDYGYEGAELEAIKEWYEDLLTYTDDEAEYVYKAYREYGKPSGVDYESIPFCKKRHGWLDVIYDCFDEICRRVEGSSSKTINNNLT